MNPDTGAGFSEYLTGLSIAAHEVSFNNPAGSGPAFGTAVYIAPTLPPSPSPNPTPVQDPANRITQHFSLPFLGGGDFGRIFSAVATAVIEIPDPPAGGEFRTADVRVVITRNGNDIVHKPSSCINSVV
ncbi:MAG: hypothetical protein ACREYE_07745 [Gammaproteobacteria bacterium]